MFEIEKDVPRPEVHAPGRAKYPFKQMKVGDSFLVKAVGKSEKYRIAGNLSTSAVRHGAKLNAKFSVGMVAEGVRVWRTK